MTRRRRAYRDPHVWVIVQVGLHCALGDHQVDRGEWVRFRRGDVFRRASCEACLRTSGITRPNRSFTMIGDPVDEKARQVGGDE